MENRLSSQKSPYLLQHAGNPVAWQPWDEAALELARREDKPIFLSVGYSTCHWCHVMERESFENETTAQVLNEHFVPIKVDREERPDIDTAYMVAVHLVAGAGGWPMSAFLLPDGRPFAGGTYFTPGRFRKLLSDVAAAYASRRDELEDIADQVTEAVRESYVTPAPPPNRELDLNWSLVDNALTELVSSFDPVHAGFGPAPKFPPHTALALLVHELAKRDNPALSNALHKTLEAMALGGMHDHIGGGFHRYATDAEWRVPHFEKMLYDNALLAQVYVGAYRLTGNALYRETAEGILAWAVRELTSPEGAFFCGLDADSEGVEGKFYTWSHQEVLAALGPADGELFCRLYNITEKGNLREERTGEPTGRSVPYLASTIGDLAEGLGRDPAETAAQVAGLKQKLLVARDRRPRPFRDDKVLASWNGLMIRSFAQAGRELKNPRYTEIAARAADFLRTHLWEGDRLLRRWREGEARISGFLDDYAFLAGGLLELHRSRGSYASLDWVRELLERALTDFGDPDAVGLLFSGAQNEPLFARPRDVFDDPLPSGNGIVAQTLVRLAEITGDNRASVSAQRLLRDHITWMDQYPHGTESLALAVALYLDAESARLSGAA